MVLRLKLSTVWMAIGLTTAILFTGCADSNYDPTKDWSNDKLYSEAKEEMAAGGYDKAIGMYEKARVSANSKQCVRIRACVC